MDARFLGIGVALIAVGTIDLAVQIGRTTHHDDDTAADDDSGDAPRFPGFTAADTLKKLQGTWKIDDDNAVTIDGSSATRFGDPAYTRAPLVVHSPCSYAVSHDDSTFDVSFAMTPTGPRMDDVDGIKLGDTTVMCDGVHVMLIRKGHCDAWDAIIGEKWDHDTSAVCELTDEGGGKASFLHNDKQTEMVVSGDVLYPADEGDAIPKRYDSIDALRAAGAEALEKKKAAIRAAADPSALVAAANADTDVAKSLEVTITGPVGDVYDDEITLQGDGVGVTCKLDDTSKLKHPKQATVKGMILDVDDITVTLDPCTVVATPAKPKHH